jgi:hypothetical protein
MTNYDYSAELLKIRHEINSRVNKLTNLKELQGVLAYVDRQIAITQGKQKKRAIGRVREEEINLGDTIWRD